MCNHRYSPEQAINAVYSHYVERGGLPAIDQEGRKLYLINGNGCGVTVLATPQMREMLALTDHHVSPACKLADQNINIAEIIDAPGWCPGTVTQFLQGIQEAHDKAADHFLATMKFEGDGGKAHDIFCGELTNALANVAREFDLPKLALDLKLRQRPKRAQMGEKAFANAPRFVAKKSAAPREYARAL